MSYTIKKNVPIPAASTGGRPSKYPFGKLEVGDSFVVPYVDASAKQIRQAAAAFGRRNQMKFVVREIAEGTAVWRQ